ncbi:MAG: DUF6265 family protein [Bacteroidota bacterium]
MIKPTFLFFVLCVVVLQSCNKYDANGKLIKEYEELDKAKWLLGNWEKKDSLGTLTESWQILDDSTYVGQSIYITSKEDTVHKETIELMQNGDFLLYSATVKGENKDEPTQFQLRENIDSLLVFENPKHNYPQKIRYQLNIDKSVFITISGTQNGKTSSESYLMQKKE